MCAVYIITSSDKQKGTAVRDTVDHAVRWDKSQNRRSNEPRMRTKAKGGWRRRKAMAKMSQVGKSVSRARRPLGTSRLRLIGWRHSGLGRPEMA